MPILKKKDFNDLKKFVLENYPNQHTAAQLVKEHPQLFEDMDSVLETTTPKPVLINYSNDPSVDVDPEEDVHDITHETEDESLSIEKKEKELIIRALRKNNNKRKYAARDLGISERTLYRKIKQYDLENWFP